MRVIQNIPGYIRNNGLRMTARYKPEPVSIPHASSHKAFAIWDGYLGLTPIQTPAKSIIRYIFFMVLPLAHPHFCPGVGYRLPREVL